MPAAKEEEPCFGSGITDCNIHQHKNKQLQTLPLEPGLTVCRDMIKKDENSKGLLGFPFITRNSQMHGSGKHMRSLLLDWDGGP